jgi:hypothetical protein
VSEIRPASSPAATTAWSSASIYPQIRALYRRVRLIPKAGAEHARTGSTVTIALADGRRLEGRADNRMLEPGELDDKFLRLTRRTLGKPGAPALFQRLQRLESEADLSWLSAQL